MLDGIPVLLNFDYLHDVDQGVARALGAERTPEVFLFDRSRALVYHGAIDDNRDDRAVDARGDGFGLGRGFELRCGCGAGRCFRRLGCAHGLRFGLAFAC